MSFPHGKVWFGEFLVPSTAIWLRGRNLGEAGISLQSLFCLHMKALTWAEFGQLFLEPHLSGFFLSLIFPFSSCSRLSFYLTCLAELDPGGSVCVTYYQNVNMSLDIQTGRLENFPYLCPPKADFLLVCLFLPSLVYFCPIFSLRRVLT